MKLTQKLAIGYIRARLRVTALVSQRKAAKDALSVFGRPMIRANKKLPAIFKTAEKISLKVQGHRVHGYYWRKLNNDGNGQGKVLILHGFGSSIKKFDHYVPPLIARGKEVLAFDAPAHGESGGRQINLPLYVAMIQKICEEFGPVQSFLAHSFGGMAVAHYLTTVPHNRNYRCVLIAPMTEMVTTIDIFFNFLQLDQEVRKNFDLLIREKTGHDPEYFSIRRAAQTIDAGILWFHDHDDSVTPISDVLPVKKDRHPNIQFVFTRGLGHRNIYRDKTVVQKAIDFL